ncbi:tetratricopeptide repeat protein [Raineya orbicola]|jgi:Flp pilus assembly protein TadD|uniref:TPR repeat n=1 Tax=Raineya orbicola TaxID=2016530 RepID=A0A2N3IKA7_9BACT|nr:tetratricopeptide repeat protein [Raineya orbicola]PKQ70653.1 TPR repeat [Raineya orbicola]
MKNLILAFIFFISLSCWAQREEELLQRRHNRLLEDRIRSLENNYRHQIENLQAQILLLSAKDTTQQKQMLSTLQFYLAQIDKKYAEELSDLKKQKDERKNEIGQIVQNHTFLLQQQINQQASMLLFGGLGIVVLCVVLFFVALKMLKDQQERQMQSFALNQQSELKTQLSVILKDILQKELKSWQSTQNANNSEYESIISSLKNKITELEKQLNRQNIEDKTTITNELSPNNETEKPIQTEIFTIAEINTINPNEKKIEKESIENESEQISEKPLFHNNREWVDAIEQKINESLKEESITEITNEEEIVEEIIYEKDTFQPTAESETTTTETENTQIIHNPEYDSLIAQAMMAYENKDFSEAISLYSKAIEISPDYLAYTRRANCYHILKKYDQAAEDYEKAIRLKKDFIPAYNNAIEIYILTDNFFQALTLLERLTPIEKSHSHKAVELYLKLIAQKGLMQNTEKTEREIDELLRENFTFNFSVKEIEDWLLTADIDATDKKLIRVKTELLKLKREYASVA